MTSTRRRATLVALVMAAMVLGATPATANLVGDEGCSPGFWKNHTDRWLEDVGVPIPTDRNFYTTFGGGPGLQLPSFQGLSRLPFIDALQGGGGPGLAGAEKILARAATAAYLNAATEEMGFPIRRADMRVMVQGAWGNRSAMLALASTLDGLNNLGAEICS